MNTILQYPFAQPSITGQMQKECSKCMKLGSNLQAVTAATHKWKTDANRSFLLAAYIHALCLWKVCAPTTDQDKSLRPQYIFYSQNSSTGDTEVFQTPTRSTWGQQTRFVPFPCTPGQSSLHQFFLLGCNIQSLYHPLPCWCKTLYAHFGGWRVLCILIITTLLKIGHPKLDVRFNETYNE